jgi:hypothetical protein
VTVRLITLQRFFGVGQGLFADGRVYVRSESAERFRWVYDCGTSSSQTLIDSALQKFLDGGPRVDASPFQKVHLATLSHFDRDHISGLVRLLKSSSVDTLMMPYVPLWQRLSLAFIEGIDTQQELFGFFLNPIEYISRLNTQLHRIILVPTGRGEKPTDQGDRGSLPVDDVPWSLDAQLGDPGGSDEAEDARLFRRTKRVAVEWLRRGGRLSVAGAWEFVPYNDADMSARAGGRFLTAVARSRDDLLSANDEGARARALAAIKNIYDRAFGRSPVQRNLISLFLYSGPCLRTDQAMVILGPHVKARDWHSQTGTLYTGDGFLDTPRRLAELAEYLGTQRLRNLGCLQVMHHGAKDNWHRGLAAKLNPSISVFSSDPAHRRLGHPHAEVLRDFWTFGPTQVDKERDLAIGVVLL